MVLINSAKLDFKVRWSLISSHFGKSVPLAGALAVGGLRTLYTMQVSGIGIFIQVKAIGHFW